MALDQHEPARASALRVERLPLVRGVRAKHDVVRLLHQFGRVAYLVGVIGRATRLFAAGEGLREAVGVAQRPIVRQQYKMMQVAALGRMAPATLATAWADGRTMSLEQAVAYALDETQRQ